jgi:pimeloyl-ACP methyl ester carboxylesterase
MAIQKVVDSSILLAKNLQLEFPFDKTDFNFSAAIFYDDGGVGGNVVKQPCVIMHHGSGTGPVFPDVTNPTIAALIGAGFNVIAFRHFGSGDSSDRPRVSTNTTGNHPFASWQYYANLGAWTVQASLEYWRSIQSTYFTDDQVGLWGQSQGANFILSWSGASGTPGFYDPSVVRSIFINGATPPSNGAKSSRSMMRQITHLDAAYSYSKHPMVTAYGDRETFAPADLNKRIFYSQRGKTDITFFAPARTGNASGGHSWPTFDEENIATAVTLFSDLYNATPPETPLVPITEEELIDTIPSGFTFARSSDKTVTTDEAVVSVGAGNPAFQFDYTTHSPGGLLISSLRTNIIPDSEDTDTTFSNLVFDPSITDPFGNQGTFKLVEGVGAAIHGRNLSLTVADNNVVRCVSIYVRAGERTCGYLEIADGPADPGFSRVFFDLSTVDLYSVGNGTGVTNGAGFIEDVGNGWFRIARRALLNTASTTVRLRIRVLDEPINKLSYEGDGESGFYICAPQVEELVNTTARHSSYIPTTGTAVTRVADTLQLPSRTRTEGTFVVKYKNDRGTATAANAARPIFGSSTDILFSDGGFGQTTLALAYSSEGVRFSRNGGAVQTEAPISFPSTLFLGGSGSVSGDQADLAFSFIEEFDTALPDDALRVLSAK